MKKLVLYIIILFVGFITVTSCGTVRKLDKSPIKGSVYQHKVKVQKYFQYQQKVIHRKPLIVEAPLGCCSYLTPGKQYKVIPVPNDFWNQYCGWSFYIVDDDGSTLFCNQFNCSHLNYSSWIIKKYR